MKIDIGKSTLSGPLLIPSISSFETRTMGAPALQLQDALQEPISLVSAFDLYENGDLAAAIKSYRMRGRVMFLDSGGYEFSRFKKPIKLLKRSDINLDAVWSFDKYKTVCETQHYDLVASFDTFIGNEETYSDFKNRIISFLQDHDFVENNKLVPVIHRISDDGLREIGSDQFIDLIDDIAANINPSFIAIPERELGDGLIQKYSLTKSICDKLKKRDVKLHVLGCGNLLTFAILSHAGIALADGLEWCRTFCGRDFHLYHFQHFDTVGLPELTIDNPIISAFGDSVTDMSLFALARNLHAQQDFCISMQQALSDGTMINFLTKYFPITEQIKSAIR